MEVVENSRRVVLPEGYVAERRDAPSRSYFVYRAPDGTICRSRPDAWRHFDGEREARPAAVAGRSPAAPRSASVGRARPAGGPARSPAARSSSSRRVSLGGVEAEAASGQRAASSAARMAAVPVAEQQVTDLSEHSAVYLHCRGSLVIHMLDDEGAMPGTTAKRCASNLRAESIGEGA